MAAITVNSKALPQGDNRNFSRLDLPTPQQVRAKTELNEDKARAAYRPDPIRFDELGVIVKWGQDVTIAEGQCLWLLRKHLSESVPVPEIYGWARDGDQTFLYLELVKGQSLLAIWESLESADKVSICNQLRGIISQYRRLERKPASPASRWLNRVMQATRSCFGWQPRHAQTALLSNISGGPLRDIMFEDAGSYPAGPFATVKSFHDFFARLTITRSLRDASTENPRDELKDLQGLTDDVPVVFTHADLDVSNILISSPGDGPPRIVAIIDWHQSGWYPEPWEWLKARMVTWPDSEWKAEYVEKICDPPDDAYAHAWEYISMATI